MMHQLARVVLCVLVAGGAAFAPAARLSNARADLLVVHNTPLTANGKRVEAAPGSSLMAACNKLGLRVPTSCKKGDCGTCTVDVGGKQIRACTGKVPPAPKLKSVMEKGLPVKLKR